MRRALLIVLLVSFCYCLLGVIHISGSSETEMMTLLSRSGDLLVANNLDGALILYDVTDLMNPTPISTIPEIDDCSAAVIEGSYLYALTMPTQIYIVNIEHPETPVISQTIDIGGHSGSTSLKAFDVLDDRLVLVYQYSSDGDYHMRWLRWDVSDPVQPTLHGFAEGLISPDSVRLYGDYTYALDGYSIYVYDNTQPGWVQHDVIELGFSAYDIFLQDGILYTASYSNGLRTYEISQNNTPNLLDQIAVTYGNISIENNTAIIQRLSYNDDPINIVDVEDPAALELLGCFTAPENKCVVENDELYILMDNCWTRFDFSDPSDPVAVDVITGLFNYSARTYFFEIRDNLLFSLDSSWSVSIYGHFSIHDISNPGSPCLLSWVYDYSTASDFDVFEDLVVLCDGAEGLRIFDISDVSSPQEVATYTPEVIDEAKEIVIRGDYIYFTYDNVLSIVFINDPENPLLHTEMPMSGPNDHMKIDNDMLFLWDEANGLDIYNLSGVVVPQLMASIQADNIRDVVFGEAVFAIIGETSVDLYDHSNPGFPVWMSTITVDDDSSLHTGLFDGSRLMLADNQWYRILTYDLSNLQEPALTKTYSRSHPVEQMQRQGDFLYASNGYPYIEVLDCSAIDNDPQYMPRPELLMSNYPNPFNPCTTISLEIPNESNTELTIYNVRGQKVRTLVDERMKAGKHLILWDGTDDNGNRQASGVYLYRVKSGELDRSRKMILIK